MRKIKDDLFSEDARIPGLMGVSFQKWLATLNKALLKGKISQASTIQETWILKIFQIEMLFKTLCVGGFNKDLCHLN